MSTPIPLERASVAASGRGTGEPRGREPVYDVVRVAVVTGVIVVHAAVTYGTTGTWVYREPILEGPYLLVLTIIVGIASFFGLGLLFFIAGVLAPPALTRRGVAGFVRHRAVRLGLPAIVVVLFLRPALDWLIARSQGAPASLAHVWAAQLTRLDTAGLWFVVVLLLFSLAYAVVRARRRVSAPDATRGATLGLPGRVVAFALAATTVATVLVRVRWPLASETPLDLHLWQWPQYLAMFVLGAWAGEQGRTGALSPRTRLGVGAVALVAACALPAAALLGARDVAAFSTGLGLNAWLMGFVDAGLGIALSLWLIELVRAHLHRARPWLQALARGSLGAYVLQSAVLVPLALAMHPWVVPAELKLLLLATGGVVGSFALSLVLTVWLPGTLGIRADAPGTGPSGVMCWRRQSRGTVAHEKQHTSAPTNGRSDRRSARGRRRLWQSAEPGSRHAQHDRADTDERVP